MTPPPREADPPPTQSGFGARLHAARESAGLSIDAVAGQLKLAPRQVKALEDEDYESLPERAFIRGFVRNYARLLHVDPELLLTDMPRPGEIANVEGSSFRRKPSRMTEIPRDDSAPGGFPKWIVPVLLAAVIVSFAAYAWLRKEQLLPLSLPGSGETGRPAESRDAPGPGPAPVTSPLPPPAVQPVAGSASAPEQAPPAGAGTSPPSATAPGAGPPGGPPAADAAAPPTPAGSPGSDRSGAPGGPLGEIRLAFGVPSWVEVRDGRGRIVHSQTNPAGSARTVTGDPPFELVIGNAHDVRLTYNGQPVDLAAHTRANIARLTLK